MSLLVCKSCGFSGAFEYFAKDRTRPTGFKNICKTCHKNKAKLYREADPERQREIQRKSKEKGTKHIPGLSYSEKRNVLDAIKSERGCYFCFENTPICLDFHHRDMTKKEFTISKHFHQDISVLLKEIEKCEVVCSNCHRKLHAGLIVFNKE